MTRALNALLASFSLVLLAALGCGKPPVDPAVLSEHRQRFVLPEEPDGAQTVLEVRQAMYGVDPAEAAAHEDHDHDGDGVQDHAPEDHPQDEHDHADHEHADHDHADDAGDDVEPAEGEVALATGEAADADHAAHDEDHAKHDHEHGDHDHADHDHEGHADHDHDEHAHEDHDHDGDGVQDHTPEEHDAAMAALDPFADKDPVVEELDVVMVGSVGGVPNPTDQSHPDFPFAEGKAVFFLADPEAVAEMEEHSHQHAPGEECSFCAAHAADSAHLIAVVEFADENGRPLAIDARELFDLKEKETVVVRGKAKIAPGGMLVVDATGLYVRR